MTDETRRNRLSRYYPDIPAGLPQGPYFRSLGGGGNNCLIGAGFMEKRKEGADHTNFTISYHSLSYIISGSGTYVDSWGKSHRLIPGSIFQRFPGYLHSNYIDPGAVWTEFFIDLDAGIASGMQEAGMLNPATPCGHIGLSRDWAQAFIDIRIEIEEAAEDQLRLLVPKIIELQQRILMAAQRPARQEDQALISLACQMLSADPAGRHDIRQMCREKGWGYEKFRKLFREAVGVSPAQYRIRRRIDEARRLLRGQPELSIQEIAERLGYSTVYEFNSQFSEIAGIPPGRFRKG